ncbi:MAG TPA: hypothetical protein VG325_12675 [Solirubrobacteraceae bacterium]|nr:hypothetical protein [Solirubrobacteraceae bacterium]
MTDPASSEQPPQEPRDDVPAGDALDARGDAPNGPDAPDAPAGAPPVAGPPPTPPTPPVGQSSPPPGPVAEVPAPVPPLEFGTTAPGATTYETSSSGGLESLFPPDRPERAVGAAFAGGLVLALILKRLGR